MKLPISWLQEYVNIPDSPQVLAQKLAEIGFEVESIIEQGAEIDKVVVGKIVNIVPHPNADKLIVCLVNTGDKTINIVTGANNIKEGDFVPVALDGAKLPNNKAINVGELRGVLSEGMLCSASELGITSDLYDGECDSGIMILSGSKRNLSHSNYSTITSIDPKITATSRNKTLSSPIKIGMDIKELFGLNDTILDISITANRPDCQSIYGLAREIATLYHKTLAPLRLDYKTATSAENKLKTPNVEIEDEEFCSTYLGQIVENIKVDQSVDLIRQRLSKVGVRPINNIVDITNYVLIEVGQPMHAFNYDFVSSGIFIKKPKNGEKLLTLNGIEYTLDSNQTVIASKTNILAIAGVIGGKHSAIQNDTTNIFFESACFERAGVRSASRSLGIRTDSSARYEKGVNVGLQAMGLHRALHLIDKYKIGRISADTAKAGLQEPKPKTIHFDTKQIKDLLGIHIPDKFIQNILSKLDIKTKLVDNQYTAIIPNHRSDMDDYPDIAEELIRFYGYDKLTSTLFQNAHFTKGSMGKRQDNLQIIRNYLCGFGYHEMFSYSFVSKEQIEKLQINDTHAEYNQISIKNPLSIDLANMRTMLVGCILEKLALNHNRKNKDFGLFELGKVYLSNQASKTKSSEIDKLCIGAIGIQANFYSIKNVIFGLLDLLGIEYKIESTIVPFLNPYCGLDIKVNDKNIGFIGQVHPLVLEDFDINTKVVVAELDINDFIHCIPPIKKTIAIPKYPSVYRDLAFIVQEDTTAQTLLDSIQSFAGHLCKHIEIFDIYQGEQVPKGHKSVALSLMLQTDNTLTETTINQTMQKIIDGLTNIGLAKIRES